jgi:hypothetical protein
MGVLLAFLLAIDPALARSYLSDFASACGPARTFWHHDLCGPVVLADPATRAFVTADREGTLPASIGLANTAVDWNGQKWTMILWPLPGDREQRLALMFHESFHRIQGDLGLPMASPANAHLDILDGRYYLQLEFRALAAALKSEGSLQRRAAADAVAFRRQRRALFPTAASTERALEMNEGLAEYTGVALSGAPVRLALLDLETYAAQPSFVRSFAYATGPAYGDLLDQYERNWRTTLKPTDDLSELLIRAMNLAVPLHPSVDAYNGASLHTQEAERDQSRQRRVAALRKLLVDGPVLTLPLEQMQMDFNPNNLIPIEGIGTVYPTITIRDVWGAIQVSDHALISQDFKKLFVSAPAQGTAWKLDLKPGWKIAPAQRPGDQTIASSPH